ncbi:MAG: [protein-PII] uridylyltransferase [Pseudomonadota bacterium]
MLDLNIFEELAADEPVLQFLNHDDEAIPDILNFKKFRGELLDLLKDRFKSDSDIYYLISLNTCIVDVLLKNLWSSFDIPENSAAFIAIGGYGRRELFPESDIDIMIMLQENIDITVTSKVEAFLTFLWDINLPIAQSVRTAKECVAEAKNDITVMTSLMEHYFLAGNKSLYKQLLEITQNNKIWPSKKYFKEKSLELTSRHSKYGDTANNLEPNVKENPGGLRDTHTLRWLTNRHFKTNSFEELVKINFLTQKELERFIKIYTIIAKVRFALHLYTGRGEDRLLFDFQHGVATLLGYHEKNRNQRVEAFMQSFYRASNQLATLSQIIINRLQSQIFPALFKRRAKKINDRFQSRGSLLETTHVDVFNQHPSAILELFNLLQTEKHLNGPSHSLIQQILENLEIINQAFREHPDNRDWFMKILNSAKINIREIRRMAQLGVLGKYWPSFDAVTGRMQFDLFHVYTVEEHTLSVLRNTCAFSDANTDGEYATYHDIFIQTPKAIVLYLAALFHDIAKGRGGDHSELGEKEARDFCLQHGLGTFDSNLVAWLVRNHLIMSVTAQNSDISDPDVINEFAERVGNLTHLNYLYLLTIADIRGTNPKLWNSWRSSLLAELYESVARVFRRGLDSPIRREEIINQVKDSALQRLQALGKSKNECLRFWDELDDEYFLRHSDEEVMRHTQAVINNQKENKVIVNIHQYSARGATEIFVYCDDRNHLFAHITFALVKIGLTIAHARIITSKKGHALDTFLVLDSNGKPIDDQKQCEIVEGKLTQALLHPEQIDSNFSQGLSRRIRELQVPVEIYFDNMQNNLHTSLEIKSPDFSGLLACVGNAFIECNIAVHNARISKLGERVHNIFKISTLSNEPLNDEQKTNLAETIRRYLEQPKQIALAV